MHSNWRDCQEWREEGLPMSTVSNVAAKLYDAALTQYVGRYDDTHQGGLNTTLDNMMSADPDFVMGRVLKCGLDVLFHGKSIESNSNFLSDVNYLNDGINTLSNDRERKHCVAIKLLAERKLKAATDQWQDIIVDYPTDFMALTFSDRSYFYMGAQMQTRDNVAKVIPLWKPSHPLYGYLHSMHAFGLAECKSLHAAERSALKALDINKYDSWGTHALTHALVMQGRVNEGREYLLNTEDDWTVSCRLSYHLYWHWALAHIENGEFEEALYITDNYCLSMMKNIADVATLLTRLELEGVDVGKRWNKLHQACQDMPHEHVMAYNDIHLLMALAGAQQQRNAEDFLDSIRKYMRLDGYHNEIMRSIGYDISQALMAFYEGRYDDVVSLLVPIKYDIVKIGGSDAHRDIYNLLLIHAAMRSKSSHNHRLAKQLLHERQALSCNSPLTDRLKSRVITLFNSA